MTEKQLNPLSDQQASDFIALLDEIHDCVRASRLAAEYKGDKPVAGYVLSQFATRLDVFTAIWSAREMLASRPTQESGTNAE